MGRAVAVAAAAVLFLQLARSWEVAGSNFFLPTEPNLVCLPIIGPLSPRRRIWAKRSCSLGSRRNVISAPAFEGAGIGIGIGKEEGGILEGISQGERNEGGSQEGVI